MGNGLGTVNCAVVRIAPRAALVSKFTTCNNKAYITKRETVVCDCMPQPPNEITMPIAEAVSEVLETRAETLPPLSESIDVDGLEALMTDNPAHDVTVTFAYAGLRVLVHSDRTVYVRPLQNAHTGLHNETTENNR